MNIKRTTSEQQVHTNKNEKNYKNEKNNKTSSSQPRKSVFTTPTQLLHSRGGVIQTDLSESGNQKPNLQSWADNSENDRDRQADRKPGTGND